jgi:hypothetical protein
MITPPASPYANAIAPFTPLGREPVGQESAELRLSTFKPLEQSAESGRSENRRSPDERPSEVDEQQRLRDDRIDGDQHKQQNPDEQKKRQQEEVEREVIRELAARDREVRAHEQAHAAVGGHHAGSPTYQYKRGPDGVSYAVAGEVSISTSPIPGDPEATIRKAQQIARAAMAPAEPSPQDRRVAAEASRLEIQARAELQQGEILHKAEQAEAAKQKARAEREEAARQERREQDEQNKVRAGEEQARAINVVRRLAEIGLVTKTPLVGHHINHRI